MKRLTILSLTVLLIGILNPAAIRAQEAPRPSFSLQAGAWAASKLENDITKGYASLEAQYTVPVVPVGKNGSLGLLAAAAFHFSLPHQGESAHCLWSASAGVHFNASALIAEPYYSFGAITKDKHTHLFHGAGLRTGVRFSPHTAALLDASLRREFSCLTNHTHVEDPQRMSVGIILRYTF